LGRDPAQRLAGIVETAHRGEQGFAVAQMRFPQRHENRVRRLVRPRGIQCPAEAFVGRAPCRAYLGRQSLPGSEIFATEAGMPVLIGYVVHHARRLRAAPSAPWSRTGVFTSESMTMISFGEKRAVPRGAAAFASPVVGFDRTSA